MLPLKRILCPTDFSADSRAALRVAGEMAQYFSAELMVLYVCVSPQPAVWPYEGLGINPVEAGLSREETLALREKELATEARETLPPDLDLKLTIREGDPAAVILETAAQQRSDLNRQYQARTTGTRNYQSYQSQRSSMSSSSRRSSMGGRSFRGGRGGGGGRRR